MSSSDLWIVFSCIFIPVFISLILSLVHRPKIKCNKKMTNQSFVVMIDSVVAFIGGFLAVVSVAILFCFTLFSNEPPHIIFYIVFGLFVWLGMYLVFKTLCFRVVVKNETITAVPLFRKPFTFTFDEIISVVRQVKENQVKSERMIIQTKSGKKLIVESVEISYVRFMDRIKSEVNPKCLHGFESLK